MLFNDESLNKYIRRLAHPPYMCFLTFPFMILILKIAGETAADKAHLKIMTDFSTTAHESYVWPYPKPIKGRPCEPPSPTSQREPPPPPVAPYCHCDVHAYDPKIEQYKQLITKERKLCEDYEHLQQQLVDVTNDILDHPCDDVDTKMATIYQTDYKKRAFPVVPYRSLIAAAQANVSSPMETHKIGNTHCYQDPTSIVSSPIMRGLIHPAQEANTAVEPVTVKSWFAPYPGRTEYMDTISAAAKASWRSSQRYREPAPSARRRADDPCV